VALNRNLALAAQLEGDLATIAAMQQHAHSSSKAAPTSQASQECTPLPSNQQNGIVGIEKETLRVIHGASHCTGQLGKTGPPQP